MKEHTVEMAKDWLMLLLAGLGISFQPHEFFGGLFLALFAASLARRLSPDQDDRGFLVMMGTAALAAIVTAEIMSYAYPEIMPQLVMAGAGFVSSFLARTILQAAGAVEKKAPQITEHVIDRVMPDEEDKK